MKNTEKHWPCITQKHIWKYETAGRHRHRQTGTDGRHTDKDPGRQKDKQVDPVAVWCGSETRYALSDLSLSLLYFSVIPPSAALCFFLCVLILASFFFLFCLSFFLSSGFPSLLCARDVCRRLRALCQRCPDEDQAVCSLVCVCMQIGLFGGRQQLQTLVCGIASVWGKKPTVSLSFHINMSFFIACCEKRFKQIH